MFRWVGLVIAVTAFSLATVAAAETNPLDPLALAQRIDVEIQRRLEREGLQPAPLSDDAEFLRRVSIDLTGVIPPLETITSFLDSRDPDRRAKLIDTLLDSSDYGRHQTDIWRELLLPTTAASLRREHDYMIRWLEAAFAENMPWDRFVNELLTAQGMQTDNGATTFFVTHQSVDEITDRVSRVFLGVQIQCAQCHNHPFNNWSQDQYWGLAAFFSKVRPQYQRINNVENYGVSEMGDRKTLIFPDSAKTLPPSFLGETPDSLDPEEPYLPVLAKWMTSRENPYFARATANRLWQQCFGRGLVDPIDDLREDNPPSHPELLTLLAEQFQGHGCDLKYLYRSICRSETYQRTSRSTGDDRRGEQLFARMPVRVMPPHVLYDSLQQVVRHGQPAPPPVPLPEDPREAIKARKRQRNPRESFAGFFKGEDGAAPTTFQAGVPQALRMMNSNDTSLIARVVPIVMRAETAPASVIRHLYLVSLVRPPRTDETALLEKYVAEADDSAVAYRDILWALLNSAEFVSNH